MTPELWQEIERVAGEALELPEPEQLAFVEAACSGREELVREVESLLTANRRAGKFLSAPAFGGAKWIGRHTGPYRLIEEIGHGGMGAVFLAERDDDQFRKQVAIKIVPGLLDAAAAQRFLEERQILASLVHPNIARLLDGGVTADGVPFMVMDYIAGKPITEYCDAKVVSAVDRLRLFQHVCLAVHYAHQHLIVHRDIKPANIIVAADGAPVLLDFGIAKMLDSAPGREGGTRTIVRPMTPEYASPEQLRGGAISTSTDVYSLGVLLYELLTGERPYALSDKTLEDAVTILSTVQPKKPSVCPEAVALNVSEDLDHVVAKAMRPEPEQRYGSARELADDVGRCLSGLPVVARRGTPAYIARKLAARHKGKIGAIAIIFALLVVSLAAVTRQAHIANLERAKAQRRFDELHGLAKSVIFELHDRIEKLPGSTEARKLLVARALAYLDSLAKDATGDIGLQTELAAAYRRIGDAQGRWNAANLGDPEGALASYRKGLEAVSQALRVNPGHDEAVGVAGWLNLSIGEIYLEKRDAERARRHMQEALRLFRIRTTGSDLAGVKRSDMAAALLYLFLAERLQDLRAAETYLNESASLYEAVLREHPNDAVTRSNVSLAHRYLATYGDVDGGVRHLNRALELDESAAKADPLNARVRMDVALDLAELGSRYLDIGKSQMAIEAYRKSLAIRRELAAADPENINAQTRVANAQSGLAWVLLSAGRPAEALTEGRESAALFARLSAANPSDQLMKENAFNLQALLGQAETQLGHPSRACAEFQRGQHLSRSLPEFGPADRWLREAKTKIVDGLRDCSDK